MQRLVITIQTDDDAQIVSNIIAIVIVYKALIWICLYYIIQYMHVNIPMYEGQPCQAIGFTIKSGANVNSKHCSEPLGSFWELELGKLIQKVDFQILNLCPKRSPGQQTPRFW